VNNEIGAVTTLAELQRKILEVYTQNGKGIVDFSRDLRSIINKGFSRDRALINLALQNDVEIEEIINREESGLTRDEAILGFSEDLKRAREFSEIFNTYPRKTVAHPTPNSLWYLLPLGFGLMGGLVAYVYVRDDDPEMAKNLFTVGLVVNIFTAILFYIFVL